MRKVPGRDRLEIVPVCVPVPRNKDAQWHAKGPVASVRKTISILCCVHLEGLLAQIAGCLQALRRMLFNFLCGIQSGTGTRLRPGHGDAQGRGADT